VFFTHKQSVKGKQMETNAHAALNFHWKSIRRQVRIRGKVKRVASDEADQYFSQRPRDHQLNAHASRQSQVLKTRAQLIALFLKVKTQFARKPIPRPDDWVGYRLSPTAIEFWESKRSRQHDRTLYTRTSPKGLWKSKKLFP
jgi:pyridoxamine 5'-phosphate oxidase